MERDEQRGQSLRSAWLRRLPRGASGRLSPVAHPLTSSRSCPQLLHPVDGETVHPAADGALFPLALAVALLGLRGGRRERVPAVALCSVRQARVGVSPAGNKTRHCWYRHPPEFIPSESGSLSPCAMFASVSWLQRRSRPRGPAWPLRGGRLPCTAGDGRERQWSQSAWRGLPGPGAVLGRARWALPPDVCV